MDSLEAIEKTAGWMRAAYWIILMCGLAGLIAYMGLGIAPLNSKVIAWFTMGILGGSFLLPYSTYWYISSRVNRLEGQKNVAGQS